MSSVTSYFVFNCECIKSNNLMNVIAKSEVVIASVSQPTVKKEPVAEEEEEEAPHNADEII